MARELDLGQYLRRHTPENAWEPEEAKLLGRLHDADVAAKIGRSQDAVRLKRRRLGIPPTCDRRRKRTR